MKIKNQQYQKLFLVLCSAPASRDKTLHHILGENCAEGLAKYLSVILWRILRAPFKIYGDLQ